MSVIIGYNQKMKRENPNNPFVAQYERINIDRHHYVNYGRRYKVVDLIDESKKYEVFDLQLNSIDISAKPWGFTERIADLADHYKRVMDADLKYPVILDQYGYICDGWHRVMKALIQNKKSIKAIRLLEMPDKFELEKKSQ